MGSRRRLTALAAGGLLLAVAACSGGSGGAGGAGGTPAASQPGSPAALASPGGPASPARPLHGPPLPSGMTALTPAQLRRAYDVNPLLRRGLDGRGQTIVIVDPFGSPSIEHDLAYFDQEFGLPAPPSLKVIQPTGPVPPYRPTPNRATAAAETTLDVEAAHVMAPGAGLVALAGQQAGHSLGLINPALYRMAAARDRGIVDVRRGDNSYPLSGVPAVKGYAAGSGYDLATGLGTVDAAYFVPELARLAG